ncbi:hypothetical protein OQW59_20990 [Citrobacter freundii]|uniref:hypothetical protein n=1 Tax=Citrobacter freundii TaxID=546 RepID=UPI002248F710|nr:hypothetical protein [Citrobacter freundii]UZQ88641.1 hypothetical protein OQW59_20990 [Citrobacter freundii]UZQ94978.1 hypothetical protein OQY67_25450 [Citrobacter freundii]UZQ99484.1 hypothetical protein OQZ20_21120 [Citrobacter freundii]
MGSNIIELAKLGHERASELKASCGAVDVRSLAQLISDLSTQLEVQLVRGNAQAVQLANAESKCRELAVDNASLKNPENWLLQSDYGYEASEVATQNGATEDESLRAGMIAIINRIVTPATDAFLAEVRAQGLERLAKAWYAIANETASGISISESSRLKYRQRADDVADFANEIRKEAAQ